MKPIAAGELTEEVTIQTATVTRGTANAEVVSWADVATVWAKVVERGGREPILADRPVMLVSYEVTIRAGVTVTHSDRLTWGDKTLAIDTVTPYRTQGKIVLRCMEVEI